MTPMNHVTSKGRKFGARIIAFFLLAGGLLGMLGSALSVYQSGLHHRVSSGVTGALAILLFAWCIRSGVALWKATPSGYAWAKLLFAMQIPVFTITRVSYEFSTFFSVRLLIGNTTRHVGGDIGSSLNLNLLPQPLNFLFGVNIVAVLILCYLIRSSRPMGAARLSPSAQ